MTERGRDTTVVASVAVFSYLERAHCPPKNMVGKGWLALDSSIQGKNKKYFNPRTNCWEEEITKKQKGFGELEL